MTSKLSAAFLNRLGDYGSSLTVTWLKSFDPIFNAEYYKRLRRELEKLKFDADTFNAEAIVTGVDRVLAQMPAAEVFTVDSPFDDYIYRQLTVLLLELDKLSPVINQQISSTPLQLAKQVSLVYLLDDSQLHLNALAVQVELFSFKVITFKKLDDLCIAVKQLSPAAIVADVVIEEGLTPDIWFDAFAKHGIQKTNIPPVVFMSAHDVSVIRMKSVRAGGGAFITKPINMNQLVEHLDLLTNRDIEEHYRVLIVDDQLSQGSYHASLLETQNIKTEVCIDVEEILETVTQFRPDVILMDMYMPMFTGLEVAIAIRQKVEYAGIQIIFLSSEQDVTKQQEILVTAGEAFIEKPVDPEFLVRLVKSRALYSRHIGNVMARDSLTNLFNHAEIERQLVTELLRAKRTKKPMSVAMIDIDHFKNVNDSYGHAVGDQVIKTLALLLSDSLRRTDTVGRYGGEEFVVLMPETDAATAKMVIEWQLEKFSAISSYGKERFNCSFSAGIVCSVELTANELMIVEADKRLYKAKNNGRNRVEIA